MRKKIEAFLYGRRWRADERAWGIWQGLAPLVPATFAVLDSGQPVVGRVYRVYQRAQRGSKAVVHFGDEVGPQDTWWEHMRPRADQWVVVRTHLWFPPGTHSGEHVVWVDAWESWAPGDVYVRALRHERKLEKEGLRTAQVPRPAQIEEDLLESVGQPLPGQPLFQTTGFAAGAGFDQAMASATEVAVVRAAKLFGPSEVGGSHMLTIWPEIGLPTFVTITARPIDAESSWVGVSAQGLDPASIDITDEVKADLEAVLSNLGPGILPPPRNGQYDRVETRRLEAETQELLEVMAAKPSSWDSLTGAIYLRELMLQSLVEELGD